MSYLSISVKEAVNKINGPNNGWFLPSVQRPFVWGSRYENELYICKLFDSILRGYPIGGLIVWNTENEVPYREFMRDFFPNETQKIVDKGLWNRKDKWLIYDGQQRLQTLYSCLKYIFNGKILAFNLLFDINDQSHDPDETGFFFVDKNADLLNHQVRMNELFSKSATIEEKRKSRNKIIRQESYSEEQQSLIEDNCTSSEHFGHYFDLNKERFHGFRMSFLRHQGVYHPVG